MLERHRYLNQAQGRTGPVVCWLSRDQRAADNWALVYAQSAAISQKQPLWVIFCLQDQFLGALPRNFAFMLAGLRELAGELAALNIPFQILEGDPGGVIPPFCQQIGASLLVCDFSPLRIARQWKSEVSRKLSIPVAEVDAHNIIPCWQASPHQEFGAYTLRPKVNRQLEAWLTEMPPLLRHPFPPGNDPAQELQILLAGSERILQAALLKSGGLDRFLPVPGTASGLLHLKQFISERLIDYPQRNDPNKKAGSGLSPWLHFGQIAPQRVALSARDLQRQVPESPVMQAAAAEFLEELIVRRELADNFCFYNTDYDNPGAFPAWARQTLEIHRRDPRPYVYTENALEAAETADPLWNAAQREMVRTGLMPGYLRMYWAKKILEWTLDPGTAQAAAIKLNDRYSLDGRDPNGYAGIAWSIGGVHDRAWGERPVFGKIRTMTLAGCRRKFDVDSYILSVD